MLLQILDDGRLTDSHGRTVDFKNTVVIMTSNIGSQFILDMGSDEKSYLQMKERVLEALHHHFRPEFLNRVDEIMVFRSLTEKQLEAIVEIQVNRLRERLAEKEITLEMTEPVKKHLSQIGYDPVYGARPLKRMIQRELETPIAKEMLSGNIHEGDHVVGEMQGDQVAFHPKARGTGRKTPKPVAELAHR